MSEDAPALSNKPSQIPSWVMLGFMLGALFVWFLPHPSHPEFAAEPAAPAPKPVAAPPPAIRPQKPSEGPPLARIENVFDEWGKYAVWDNDTTEVALWNTESRSFSDRFEVLRMDERYYFRSIAEFTRPELTHGVPAESPLEFTETEEQRQQWIHETEDEAWKALGRTMGNQTPPKP
jgi:hypothetical protein